MDQEIEKMRRVLEEVLAERINQENKWGQQNHTPADYLMILGEEVGEANKSALEARFGYKHSFAEEEGVSDMELHKEFHLQDLREELIQVAAVAVAMVESLDRNELKKR